MKSRWKRVLAGTLSLALAASLSLNVQGAGEVEEAGDGPGQTELVTPLEVTTGRYTPRIPASYGTVQPGGLYTLIALPSQADPPAVLTAQELLRYSDSALFIGWAVADEQGGLTFENVRLRSALAAVYYVTGPGLTTPYREATNAYTSAYGAVTTASADSSATITLVDHETGYHYNSVFYAAADGSYATGNIAPGTYKFRIEKPGYLPYLSTDRAIDDLGESYIPFNISDNIGDVTNDGVRDMADLAAVLRYYGAAAGDLPALCDWR